MRKFCIWSIVLILLLIFFSLIGTAARSALLAEGEPFPSWTYNSNSPFLNAWTSWDSGFYYDIAQNGYPEQKDLVTVATVPVPQDGWTKIFTGYLQVGESRFALPSERTKISNVVFLLGKSGEPTEAFLYSVNARTPYCRYKGPIDYERDVLIHKDSLTNPTACGDAPCERVYITYYDVPSSEVVYQEYFDQIAFDEPRVTIGTERPKGFGGVYEGFGCDSVGEDDIESEQNLNFRKKYTPFPFGFVYPYLARAGAFVFGDIVLAGLVLSLISTVLAACFLYYLAARFLDERTSMFISFAYILFPGAFFNLTFQPVSLLALFFFASVYFAVQRKPLLFGLTSLFFAFTGPYYLGLILLIPLYFALNKELLPWFMGLGAVLLGVIIRILNIYSFTGDLLAIFKSQAPWMGGAVTPLAGLGNYFAVFDGYKAFEGILFLLLFVFSGWFLFGNKSSSKDEMEGSDISEEDNAAYGMPRELGISFLAAFAFVPILNGGFGGILKYYFLLVPAFFSLGKFLSRSKAGRVLAIIFLISLNALFMVLWTTSSRFIF